MASVYRHPTAVWLIDYSRYPPGRAALDAEEVPRPLRVNRDDVRICRLAQHDVDPPGERVARRPAACREYPADASPDLGCSTSHIIGGNLATILSNREQPAPQVPIPARLIAGLALAFTSTRGRNGRTDPDGSSCE